MITVLIYKPESKIKAQFDGPLSRHQANIDAYGSDYVGIEWINPDIRNKKAELIDGSWQLVDDIPKVIESKRIEKINDISSEKAKALSTGMSFPGEVHDGAQWFAQDLTVGFTGNDYRATRKIIDKFSIIGHAPTAMQTSRLLRGRDKFQLILSGKEEYYSQLLRNYNHLSIHGKIKSILPI